MASMVALGPTTATDSQVIEADLTCIHCGYNLRTLRRDGLCPECGRAVASSLVTEFDFASAREVVWRRRGIGCWAGAICAGMLAYLIFLVATLCCPPFWHEMGRKGSLPYWVYLVCGRMLSFSWVVTIPLQSAAIVCIVGADLRVRSRLRRWLGAGIALMTIAGGAGFAYTHITIVRQLPTMGPLVLNETVAHGSVIGYEVAMIVAWLFLLWPIRRRWRLLRAILWVGFAVLVARLATEVAQVVLAKVGTGVTQLGGGVFTWTDPPAWEAAVRKCISFVSDEARFPTDLLLCLGLWGYLRCLNRASRWVVAAGQAAVVGIDSADGLLPKI